MKVTWRIAIPLVAVAAAALQLATFAPDVLFPPDTAPPPRVPGKPDIIFITTPQEYVEKMLEMADVHEEDVVYDLGCGDGRFVITAAERFGARGVGIDIDPQLVKQSQENAERAGVSDRVRFVQGDLFEFDFHDADVVTLFLLPELNVKLLPQLQQLKPGARIVSYVFGIEGYPPDRVEKVASSIPGQDQATIYLWVAPLRRADN